MKLSSYIWKIKDFSFKSRERLRYMILARKHGRDLHIKQNNLHRIKKKDILLFATLRNESSRIPFFLQYYRKLGIKHFVFVDNHSTDNFMQIVSKEKDISVFHCKASYKKSNFGMHWLNHLLNKYGKKHWCLTCDPDEFFVYPQMDRFPINHLCSYLEQCHRESFFSLMLDMYGSKPLSQSIYSPGIDPLKLCPYFDKAGYFFRENSGMNSLWAQGGVRIRKYFPQDPHKAPALNKIPLIKWKKGFAYISSMHQAIPRRLNSSYRTELTGVILHFKYFSSFIEKVNEEIERKQHYGNSGEYKKYYTSAEEELFFHPDISLLYKGWKQLTDLGLMKGMEWE